MKRRWTQSGSCLWQNRKRFAKNMMAKPTKKTPRPASSRTRWTVSPSCVAFHHRHSGLYFRIDHGRQKAMRIASMNKNANYETNPTSILSSKDMNGGEKIG